MNLSINLLLNSQHLYFTDVHLIAVGASLRLSFDLRMSYVLTVKMS